jgi:RNA polymerase sigma factor (sigma-70 family)
LDRINEKEYWLIIWEKFRQGDRQAFEILYNEYVNELFSYGMRFIHDKELVEDSIQDVFLSMYNYGNQLKKPESLRFYIYKTLKNSIIRKIKEKYRFRNHYDFDDAFDLKFPFEDTDTQFLEENLSILRNELSNLDAKKRELIFLKFNSGLTYNEIGELLNCNAEAVKKQVQRILKFLRNKIGDNFLLFLFIRSVQTSVGQKQR